MEKINLEPKRVFSPQPVFIIGTKNPDESPNFSVITWLSFSFYKNPSIVITIGGNKQTKTNIIREQIFSANLVSTDIIWLADYFGTTKYEEKLKSEINYDYKWGNNIHVPVLEKSKWIYECSVDKTIELDGCHLFLAKIENIQIDKNFKEMDLEMIDLIQLDPVLYAPYNYFSIGQRIGACCEWKTKLDIDNNWEF